MTQAVQQRSNRFGIVALVVLLGGMLGQTGWAQELARTTPQTFETPSPYALKFRSPSALRFNRPGEIILRVQNENGEPVDGVPVTFAVDPAWQDHVTLTPMQTRTQNGIARVRVRASQLGLFGVAAHAGSTTAVRRIAVTSYHPKEKGSN